MREVKRGQATMLVLVGLVILIVFSMVFYFVNQIRVASLENELEEALTEFSASSLQAFVRSCVELAAQEGLRLAALQGGYLYDSQGGTTILDPFGDGNQYLPVKAGSDIYNIAYGIKQSPIAVGPELYPSGNALYTFADYPLPYFGQNNLPKLCAKNGPNKIQIRGTGAYQTCLTGTYALLDRHPSIQDNLANYISENVPRCIGEQTGFEAAGGVSIKLQGTPNASVLWGSDSVSVQMEYPTTISLSRGKSESRAVDFSVRLPVRFKKVYNVAYSLITQDISDITYDMPTEWSTSSYVDRDIQVFYVQDSVGVRCEGAGLFNCPGAADNHVLIRDEASKLGGDPLTFQFAIANRPPDIEAFNMGAPVAAGARITLNVLDPDDEPGDLQRTWGMVSGTVSDGFEANAGATLNTIPGMCSGGPPCFIKIGVFDESDRGLVALKLKDQQTIELI